MLKLSVPFAALLLLASACGKSSVKASLTDAPIDNVAKFEVTINEVRFHDDADEHENEGENKSATVADLKDADGDGVRGKGWVVLCHGSTTFDLMTLRPNADGTKKYSALCGGSSVNVPPGKIDKLWLDVSNVHITPINGSPFDLPTADRTGLKIDIDDEDLSKTGDTELKVDFDAASSLLANLDGSLSLKPKLTKIRR